MNKFRRRLLMSSTNGLSGKYTVNLNNQWELSTSIPNPDPSKYDGVYESYSNWHVTSGVAKMTITISGYTTFSIYIRSYAEGSYDYTIAYNLDSTSSEKASTKGKQTSGTSISDYTQVTYSNIDGGTHTITIAYRKDDSADSNYDRGYVLISKYAPPEPQFDFVDLGLSNGLKWAKANLGAETETDYGKYFQWGDTVGYTDASHSTWRTCPFNNGSSEYVGHDWFNEHKSEWLNGDILKPEYDACYQWSNGKCRMPSMGDWGRLFSGTNLQWVDNYNNSGHCGMLFTSKTNSNSIFIPAAGYVDNNSLEAVGSYCYVLSSLIYYEYLKCYCALILPSGRLVYFEPRYYGMSVRCVQD